MRLLRFFLIACAALCATTASAQQLVLNWYDQYDPGFNEDSITIANPTGTSASASVTLKGVTQTVTVPAHGNASVQFPGVVGGPVFINGPSGGSLTASQAVSFGANDITSEVNAVPASAAASQLVLNWYDQYDSGFTQDNVQLANPSSTAAEVSVTLYTATAESTKTVVVPAKGAAYVNFPGLTGGPVNISALEYDGVVGKVLASRRTIYYSSFNETNAVPIGTASTSVMLPWYDQYDTGFTLDNVTVVNTNDTDSAAATVRVESASVQNVVDLQPYGQIHSAGYTNFPGHVGGPVLVSSNTSILASARTIFDYSIESFNEVNAPPSSENLVLTNYDGGYLLQNIMIANPNSSTTTGVVSVYSSSGSLAATESFSLGSLKATAISFSGECCGPAFIKSSAPVVVSKRTTAYGFNEGQWFSEVGAIAVSSVP
jgi:hypothetical protein